VLVAKVLFRGETLERRHYLALLLVLVAVWLYYFLTQTFFLGGTSPQRTRSVGRGRSKCPAYHPPTPYTLSPLLKGGEGRGEGGAYTHVPCPFGALLVILYHLKSKAFLMCGGGGHACLRGERQPHLTLPSYIQKPFARDWY